MGAAVTSYMKQAEEITAQQILAQRQTMTGLRRENQMYRRHGMLQLYGYRMRPRVYEVANIIETVLDEIDTVRQIDGPTGEAGYFPYGDAITLGFDILEDTLKCKPARDFADRVACHRCAVPRCPPPVYQTTFLRSKKSVVRATTSG